MARPESPSKTDYSLSSRKGPVVWCWTVVEMATPCLLVLLIERPLGHDFIGTTQGVCPRGGIHQICICKYRLNNAWLAGYTLALLSPSYIDNSWQPSGMSWVIHPLSTDVWVYVCVCVCVSVEHCLRNVMRTRKRVLERALTAAYPWSVKKSTKVLRLIYFKSRLEKKCSFRVGITKNRTNE